MTPSFTILSTAFQSYQVEKQYNIVVCIMPHILLWTVILFWFKQYFIHRKYIHVSTKHNGTGSDSKQSAYM